MSEGLINIPGRLKSTAIDGYIAGTSDIKDDELGKSQAQINTEINATEQNLDNRLGVVEQLAEISIGGGDAQIATGSDFNNPTAAQRAKVTTVGSILDGADDVPTQYSNNLITSGGTIDAINDLGEDIRKTSLKWVKDKTINVVGNIGATINITQNAEANWESMIVDCVEGDKFYISGKGGNNTKLWGFVDSNNKLLAVSAASLTATNLELIAPANSAKFLANSNYVSYTNPSVLILKKDSLVNIIDKVYNLQDKLNLQGVYTDAVSSLGWGLLLNGTNSTLTLNSNIVLSQNGDSIEFDLLVNETGALTNGGYSFAQFLQGIGLGVSQNRISVRSDDKTWMVSSVELASAKEQTVKIEYANGNVYVYRNGTSIGSYTGQKTITFVGFGYLSAYGYWDGAILGVKVNGEKYDIIANSTLSNCEPYRINGFLTDKQASVVKSPIVITKTDSSNFSISILNRDTGKYMIHRFYRWYGQRTINNVTYTSQDVWTSSWVDDENGNHLFQGNLNMIYRVGKVNGVASSDASVAENYHVGPSHGCEVMQFVKFFADGKEFNPATMTEDINCSTFRFLMKSNCYVVDSSIDTGNANNYPKIEDGQMVVNALHYLDATYEVDNIIRWFNRIVQVRDAAIQYGQMAGGMVQGQTAYIDNIMLNDIDNSWNEIASSGGAVVYSEPTGYDTEIIKGKYIKSNIVIMYGNGVIIRQKLINADSSQQTHSNIHTWSNDAVSAKCYMSPIFLTEDNLNTPDTINAGDSIAVYMERKIECNLQ